MTMTMNPDPTAPQGEPAVGGSDAAKLLGVTDRTVRRWRASGRLRAVEVAGVPLYPASAVVEAFLDRQRRQADPREARRLDNLPQPVRE